MGLKKENPSQEGFSGSGAKPELFWQLLCAARRRHILVQNSCQVGSRSACACFCRTGRRSRVTADPDYVQVRADQWLDREQRGQDQSRVGVVTISNGNRTGGQGERGNVLAGRCGGDAKRSQVGRP